MADTLVIANGDGPNNLRNMIMDRPRRAKSTPYTRKWITNTPKEGARLRTEPNILCEKCTSIFDENSPWPVDRFALMTYHSFPELMQSAEENCHLCLLFLNHVPQDTFVRLKSRASSESGLDQSPLELSVRRQNIFEMGCPARVKYHVTITIPAYCPGLPEVSTIIEKEIVDEDVENTALNDLMSKSNIDDCTSSGVSIENNSGEQEAKQWEKEAFTVVLEPLKYSAVPGCPQSLNTSSGESLDQVRTWLKTCLNDHPDCNTRKPEKLPTRLLDVGSAGNLPRIRLVESASLPSNTEYMTLSHCWGGHPLVKLMKDKCAEYQKEIPAEDLPVTFNEVIDFTRRMNRRYLWIDALCIIQDSADDWRKESVTMGQVYSGSVMNICAAASPDGQGGLYRFRDPLATSSCVIQPTWPLWSHEALVCYDQDGYDNDVCRSVLNERAWVLQERLLAPRMVNYTDKQIWWECRSLTASEGYPKGYVERDPLHYWSLATHQEVKGIDREDGRMFLLCFIWDRIVEEYTKRKLTYNSDKLVALSGLAREAQKIYGVGQRGRDDYFAGIWACNGSRNLLWSTKRMNARLPDSISLHYSEQNSANLPHRPDAYIAPSWSWASVNGPIYPPPQTIDLGWPAVQLMINSVGRTTPLADAFGAVTDGFMYLRAPLCEISPQTLEPIDLPYNHIGGESALNLAGGEVLIYWDDWTTSLAIQSSVSPVYLMGIQSVFSDYEAWTYGLVLMPTNAERGQYRRVGYFEFVEPVEKKPKHPWCDLEEMVGAKPLKEELYEKVENAKVWDGRGLNGYTFTVV